MAAISIQIAEVEQGLACQLLHVCPQLRQAHAFLGAFCRHSEPACSKGVSRMDQKAVACGQGDAVVAGAPVPLCRRAQLLERR